ncbi:MAG: pilus assembly protein PilM, partial [Firmicutes bacterium]|nr:pilus assembly protein PilM [Bacillota bacterium]
MAKTILGVDIGHDSLKLSLVKGAFVRKVASVQMPQNLIRDGHIVSTETMGELIRKAMRDNGIRCRSAAVVIPNDLVFIRNVRMPLMTINQLEYNLPFEFRDYISDEIKNYVFDYALLTETEPVPEDEQDEDEITGEAMELFAVAAPISLLNEYGLVTHRSGLKLDKAAPSVCAFRSLIRANMYKEDGPSQEYCMLDLGYSSIRMHMFKGDRHMVSRALDFGLRNIDSVIAEAYSVDEHLAHTYLLTNYDNCLQKEFCMNAYGNIAVELMRAVNFYRFSNPDSHLEDIWFSGGGANIAPLIQTISETLDMHTHSAAELIP